jgi:hypothetical protein
MALYEGEAHASVVFFFLYSAYCTQICRRGTQKLKKVRQRIVRTVLEAKPPPRTSF